MLSSGSAARKANSGGLEYSRSFLIVTEISEAVSVTNSAQDIKAGKSLAKLIELKDLGVPFLPEPLFYYDGPTDWFLSV